MSRVIVQGKLTVLFFLNSVCLLHYGRKHSEWIFQAAHEIQDKTMTQAFHLEADNIPVTFPRKCQDVTHSFLWQATQHRKQRGALCVYAKDMGFATLDNTEEVEITTSGI